jgi:hypothetical protein
MYKIIGADQKAYGPVSVEQIRHWIAEGRVNAHTQIQAEGASEWQPLSSFPEFADDLGASAPVPPAISAAPSVIGTREAALQAVRGPALALKITAILALVMAAVSLIIHLLIVVGVHIPVPQWNHTPAHTLSAAQASIYIIGDILGATLAVLVWIGASKMAALKHHGFALTASIIAMLPCSICCIIGLPFGIWALVALNKPEVKSHFTES